MIEAVKIWNEPNNLSHWDFEIDPEWKEFSVMTRAASESIRGIAPDLFIVLGGMSPIDTRFLELLKGYGVLNSVDAVAVHGFPLDWNHWKIDEWPDKIDEVRRVTDLPVWVTEVGVSTFGADEVQVFGIKKTAELLLDKADRVFWYSLLDLPPAWEATTRHKESEGSSYYRHFYMGIIDAYGNAKPAASHFDARMGMCQWIHFEDHRLNDIVYWMRKLGIKKLRTGLSWADWHRPGAAEWFDKQMDAIKEFDVTLTFCFTPPSRGKRPHYTSPPIDPNEFADFCAEMVDRYVLNGKYNIKSDAAVEEETRKLL